jgi:ATP phosphoribosyltransferase regulatory subunit
MQAGVEVAGVPGPDGDADAIALAVQALAAVGLARPTVDLGHLGLAREVLTALALPDAALAEARRCIAKHDGAGLSEVLRQARGTKAAIEFARLLPELAGAPDVLDAARAKAPNGGIKRALAELAAIVAAVRARKLDARLHVDLGEVRGFDYYTGVRFQAFVAGAASAVLQGGRYDGLLARYGRPSPAVGFAVDVDAVAGALESNS